MAAGLLQPIPGVYSRISISDRSCGVAPKVHAGSADQDRPVVVDVGPIGPVTTRFPEPRKTRTRTRHCREQFSWRRSPRRAPRAANSAGVPHPALSPSVECRGVAGDCVDGFGMPVEFLIRGTAGFACASAAPVARALKCRAFRGAGAGCREIKAATRVVFIGSAYCAILACKRCVHFRSPSDASPVSCRRGNGMNPAHGNSWAPRAAPTRCGDTSGFRRAQKSCPRFGCFRNLAARAPLEVFS